MTFADSLKEKWESFKLFLWNKETGEIAGRTVRSWVEITIFFIILYISLLAFWVGLLYLVQLRLPEIEDGPLYSDYLSHRGPGLHVYPEPSIRGRDKQKFYYLDNHEDYSSELEDFLANRTDDSSADFGDCSKANMKDTWANGELCVYFYLNAIHNWAPTPKEDGGAVDITCKSSKSKYDKYFAGAETYPSTGFDLSKFPWKYGMNWAETAPLVAVKVSVQDVEKSEARILCQVNAKNVFIDTEKPNIGMIDFRVKKSA